MSSGLNQLKQVLALFGHQQRKAVTLRQCRPAGSEIVAGRGLAAAVQDNNKRRRALKVFGYEREHLQRTWIRTESRDFDQRTAGNRRKVSPIDSQTIEAVQLR